MSHGNLSPRQKMINMMYLVLTALLALNVSAEILNAFQLIDESLLKTTKNVETKNEAVYAKLEAFMADSTSAIKAKEWNDKAKQVGKMSDELIEFISKKQNEIVLAAEGETTLYEKEGIAGIGKKDDANTPAEIMILKGGAKEFKEHLNKYRDDLISLIEESMKGKGTTTVQSGKATINTLKSGFNTEPLAGGEGKEAVPWEVANFEHMPLAAVITMLDKFATDIRNAESDVINFCLSQVDAGSWKFNKIEAIVNSPTNYVMQGGEYTAKVFIAASDSTQEPQIFVGERRLKVENGKGIYTGSTATPGIKSWGGVIKLESPVTGQMVEFKYKSEYQVVVPSVSVSPTKMNVFYVGVDNPVDITAAGVPADKLQATISNGSIRRSGSGYVVRVRQFVDAVVRVTADGRSLGSKRFRVRKVPDPSAVIGTNTRNWKGGKMNKTTLVALRGIRAEMENFEFDLKFRIKEFTVTCNINGFDESAKSKSGRFTPQQKTIMRKAERGSRVILESVKASGPDGTVRRLNDIVLKLR
ncbi:MAG: gliding motility protein GldM [Bacteroidota bacterium]|nr:gliding motility protein GldM [Bacteroidota bacterium]